MAISFTQAPIVAKGEKITSDQIRKLALAFNDRLRSGLGDPTTRIFFWFFSAFRQMRNPDSSFTLFPAAAEALESYAMVEAEDGLWPIAGPGEAEGANIANVINSFIFGNLAIDLDAEDVRVNDMPSGDALSAGQGWDLARSQRGAYDPNTGAMASPSFKAATSFYSIRTASLSQHGKAYGGFAPFPQAQGDCGDGTEDIPPTPNFILMFTPTRSGLSVRTYDSCTTYIAYAPFAYYVFHASGVDILSTEDYIEGPYTGGGELRKTDGGVLTRAINAYIKDFRGTEAQRADPKLRTKARSFDFQKFFTSQYHLAPNYGEQAGTEVHAKYPDFHATGPQPAGAFFQYAPGGNSYFYHAGFVMAGMLINAVGITEPVRVEVLNNVTVIKTVTIQPGENVVMFEEPSTPAPLKFRLVDALPQGEIYIQTNELIAYKPHIHDAYLVLRSASAGNDGTIDGIGLREAAAKAISDAYFSHGAVVSRGDGLALQATVNGNAVYDALRRFSHNIRVVTRQHLVAYEVVNGRSVCYFERWRAVGGVEVDMFRGIAPDTKPVGSGHIRPDYIYKVLSGSVVYNDLSYVAGERFTGVFGKSEFTGNGVVMEAEGIRRIAPRNGETNEWLMGAFFKAYKPFEESLFKPSNYADFFPMVQRCHFGSVEARNYRDLLNHFAYRVDTRFTAPEAPSGYNYVHSVNRFDPQFNIDPCIFFKSCRVYEPDPEVYSVTAEDDHIVRVEFDGRFHHCDEAPSFISRDLNTWDVEALRAEPYRTMENAIREYLLTPGVDCKQKPGDTALQSRYWDSGDVYGSCFPHFFFTRLVPLPYEDNNNSQDKEDTKVTMDAMMQMELYLRCMCEGYVDGQTSQSYGCTEGVSSLFDYTFENLCFDAFGGRWMALQPGLRAQSFGPLPNTVMCADVFNQFSKAINLLTRVRVMLPLVMECRNSSYYGTQFVTPDWPPVDDPVVGPGNGNPNDCPLPNHGSAWAVLGSGNPSASTLLSESEWQQCVGSVSSFNDGGLGCVDVGAEFSIGRWGLGASKQISEVRFQADGCALNAVPPAWRDMVSTNVGFLAIVQTSKRYSEVARVAYEDADICHGTVDLVWGSSYTNIGWKWNVVEENTTECMVFGGGVVDAGALPSSAFGVVQCPGDPSECHCAFGSSVSKFLTAIPGETNFISIPLA